MKRIIATLFMFFLTIKGHAGTNLEGKVLSFVGAGWYGEGIFVQIQNGGVIEGCQSNYMLLNRDEVSLYEENLSILLSAFHAGTKVNLYVDGCIGADQKLKAVQLTK